MAVVSGILVALAATYALLIAALVIARPHAPTLNEALRLLPDLMRLVRRLAADRTLPRRVRVRLWLLLAYLLSPIDLVPDFVPLIGYADDAILVVLALRSVVRAAGVQRIEQHWPGTEDGFAAVARLAGLPLAVR
ncbi:MAG TPA: DUF1232 domain-containing protein [Baekduia sp.]|nr:DUF1232 domain-containing protein [Baekduia sp.]